MIRPLRHVARVTIEFTTSFLIGSGEEGTFSDAAFAADANGLPAIPGSSLAGALRHAYEARNGADAADRVFGFQRGNKGCGSQVAISWGVIHRADGTPAEGLLAPATIAADPVLSSARLSTVRDHVRIGPRGVAEDRGKFDDTVVAAGHRFSFEIVVEGDATDAAVLDELLALLNSRGIRIGGKTRRGLGAFKVVRCCAGHFDLEKKADLQAFSGMGAGLGAAVGLSAWVAPSGSASTAKPIVSADVRLVPEGFWLFGGGAEGDADMNPVRETRVVWDAQGRGSIGAREFLVPGSSVKGALAHRTAFHFNALTGRFAEIDGSSKSVGSANEAVQLLFGCVKESNDAKEKGRRGRVMIDDVFVPANQTQKMVNHVSIDRFTGGALTLSGALFSESPVYRGAGFVLHVEVELDPAIGIEARRAFAKALEDLADGRLALGAGASRGNGFFKAPQGVQWSDGGAWFSEGGGNA